MEIEYGTKREIVGDLIRAFTKSPFDVIDEIKQEHEMSTENFKSRGAWDVRFDRIKHTALHHELAVLTKKRGIWTFICVLDLDSGTLFVFSKKNNLESIMKKLGRKSIHYFHAFVSVDSHPMDLDEQQLSFFPILHEEYEARRLQEIRKILGEDYPSVSQVVFLVADEVHGKILGAKAMLFNRFFEEIAIDDLSLYIVEEGYSDIFTVEETDTIEEEKTLIPKVKEQVKKRRDYFEKKYHKKNKKTKM
ncbi:hypothetical protein FK545_11275 [Planococcus glaciei]|nr:DUF5986 family protein [Planococcus glaciei]QDY45794.1 hypothetical protein FK545_11275 [Planococcus glaciei]